MRRLSNLFFLMALVLLGMTLFAVATRLDEGRGGVAGADRNAPMESMESLHAASLVHLAIREAAAILRR